MADIFISYAREDREHADRLARALEAENWSVWWDVTIPAGKRFDQVIQESIAAAKCVVVLWSTTSVKSEWVREEADEGKRRGILIPIQIEPGAQIPLGFRRIQAASLVGWDGAPTETSFQRLLRDISAVVGNQPGPDAPRPAPTTLARKAIDAVQKRDVWLRAKAVIAVLVTVVVVSTGITVYLLTRPVVDPVVRPVIDPAGPTSKPERMVVMRPPESSGPAAVAPPRQSASRPQSARDELAQEKAGIARKSAYNAIQSGSERAWSTCNQFDLLKRKEVGMQIARRIQDASREEAFRKQIEDHKANIANAFGEYSGFLDQLVGVDATIVEQEFENYRKSLEAKNSFQQIRIMRLVKRHYEQRRGRTVRVDVSAMGADCDSELGKGS